MLCFWKNINKAAVFLCVFFPYAALACKTSLHPKNRSIVLMNISHSGDTCRFSDFPHPFNRIANIKQGPLISEFQWEYVNKEYGVLQISVDDSGVGRFRFGFHNGNRNGGTWFQESVLRDSNGNELARISSQQHTGGPKQVWDIKTLHKNLDFWNSVTHIQINYRYANNEQKNTSPKSDIYKYVSVLKYRCVWPSSSGNNAFSSAEFIGVSNTSCEDALNNAKAKSKTPEYCSTQGAHWRFHSAEPQKTGLCF